MRLDTTHVTTTISALVKQGGVRLGVKFVAILSITTTRAHRSTSVCVDQLFAQTPTSLFPGAAKRNRSPSMVLRLFVNINHVFETVWTISTKTTIISSNVVTQPIKTWLAVRNAPFFSLDFVVDVSIELSPCDWIVFANCFVDIFVHYIFEAIKISCSSF